jgi:hypothetical protein
VLQQPEAVPVTLSVSGHAKDICCPTTKRDEAVRPVSISMSMGVDGPVQQVPPPCETTRHSRHCRKGNSISCPVHSVCTSDVHGAVPQGISLKLRDVLGQDASVGWGRDLRGRYVLEASGNVPDFHDMRRGDASTRPAATVNKKMVRVEVKRLMTEVREGTLGRDCLPALELRVWYPNPSRRVAAAAASRLFRPQHKMPIDALASSTSYASSNVLRHPFSGRFGAILAGVAIAGSRVTPHTNGVRPLLCSQGYSGQAQEEHPHAIGETFYCVR